MAFFQRYQPEERLTSKCPLCGGILCVRDAVKRFVKISSVEKYEIIIRRLACVVCGKLHRELPDFLLPYKQYPAACVEAEIGREKREKTVEESEDAPCAYPELSTCLRWRREYEKKITLQDKQMEEYLKGGGLCFVRTDISCRSCENLLSAHRKTGVGWLAECIRTAVNAGFVFCTEFAFSKDGVPDKMNTPNTCAGDECHLLHEKRRNGGGMNVQKSENSIVRWLILEIRRAHFQDSTAFMAVALGFSQKTLQSALNNTGGRRIVEVFEETMRYCVRNQLGLDAILMQYPGARKQD